LEKKPNTVLPVSINQMSHVAKKNLKELSYLFILTFAKNLFFFSTQARFASSINNLVFLFVTDPPALVCSPERPSYSLTVGPGVICWMNRSICRRAGVGKVWRKIGLQDFVRQQSNTKLGRASEHTGGSSLKGKFERQNNFKSVSSK
jgi:hypothetical protein